MRCDIEVDYVALDQLSTKLKSISTDMRHIDDAADFSPADFGNGVLLDAVRRFSNGWRDGREQLNDGVEKLAETVAGIAVEYERLDKRFREGGTTTPAPTNGRSLAGAPPVSGVAPGWGPSAGGSPIGPSSGVGDTLPSPGVGPASGRDGYAVRPAEPPPPSEPLSPPPEGPPPDPPDDPTSETPDPRVIELLDQRVAEIDLHLAWIGDEIGRNEGDTEALSTRRDELLAERGRLERIHELLGDLTTTPPGVNEPVVEVPDAEGPLTPNGPAYIEIIDVDAGRNGHLVVVAGDPSTAAQTVVHVSPSNGGWGQVLSGHRLGDPAAWSLVDAVPPESGGSTTSAGTAVVSLFDSGGSGDGPPGSGPTPVRRAGERMSTTLASIAAGDEVSCVVHETDVPILREAIRNGAAVDAVAIVDGSPASVSDLRGRGIPAAAVDGTGASALPDNPTASDPLARLLELIRRASGGS